MPRRKPAKRSRKNRTQNQQPPTINFQKAPTQMAAQLNKEIASLKQQASKLNVGMNNAKAEVQKMQARVAAAKEKSHTKNGAKQWKKASNNLKAANQACAQWNKEIQAVMKNMEATKDQQAKYIALQKHINQFDQLWVKQLKQIKAERAAKAAAAAKAARDAKAAKEAKAAAQKAAKIAAAKAAKEAKAAKQKAKKSSPAMQPSMEHSHSESYNAPMNNAAADNDSSELTS